VVTDYNRQEKTLFILLDEEIDQDTVDRIKRNIDDEIERYIPRKVVFDFSNITFMDSSGIGMLLGRYKLIKLIDAEMEIDNVSRTIKRIFNMSGIERIIKITSKKEEEGNNERAM
jgi:stage II sporulation protein AA (anti-sigma F factor antagonist)